MHLISHLKTKAILILTLLAFSFSAFSQAPNLLNYQGVARNSVGNPLPNQSMKLRLSVHNLLPSGTVVYSEIRPITTNLGGLFSVQIGSAGATSTSGTIAGVNWLVGDKYLQVELDPASNNNYLDIGTVQLVSVPYAFAAGSAATVKTNANLTGVVTSFGNATSIASGAITSDMIGTLNKSKVGLDLVNNTSDASKPISDLTQAALGNKLNTADSTLGYVTPTQLAAKTFDQTPIKNAISGKLNIADSTLGYVTPTQLASKTFDTTSLSNRINEKANTTDVNTALALKAPLASPSFTGTVTTGIINTGALSSTSITASTYASAPKTLSYTGSSINWDPTQGLNADIILTQNSELTFTTAPPVGSYGTVVLTQDGTGSRTITLPILASVTNKVLGSTSTSTVALSTAANAKDIVNFYYDGTNCYWNVGQGYGIAASSSTTNLATSVTGNLPVANGGTGATTLTGIVKGNGIGAMTAAIAGTDYQSPITLSTTGTGAATLSGTTLNIPTPSTISIGAIGTSNVNGANITSGVISLAPADGTNGGIVTTGAQTLAGIKSFSSSIAVGTAGAPVSSAALEVSSTVKGFLPPRMTQAQRGAINSPAQGLMIYCTNCGANGEPEYYNGSSWVNLSGNATAAAPVEIGSAYLGGILAYYLVLGDPGYDAATPHGLIAATTDQGYIEWYNGSYINTGIRGTAIGTGLSNTNAIILAQGTTVSYAARLARNYTDGTYTDWYLPSKNELNKILANIGPGAASPNTNIGGFNGVYWSSSELDKGHAFMQNGDLPGYSDTSEKQSVRAVRSF